MVPLRCHSALTPLLDAACARGDYCSVAPSASQKPQCDVSGNHKAWPVALLGSQLTRRLDVVKAAVENGCRYVHTPLLGPVAWAESHFNLGRGCMQSPAAFGADWRPTDKAGKMLKKGGGGKWHKLPPRRNRSSAVASVRHRLSAVTTPWYRAAASDVILAVHVRRGDLSYQALQSDQSRWVPDEYYEEMLPRVVRALRAAAPAVQVHVITDAPDPAMVQAPGWAGQLTSRWERLVKAAGASELRVHVGEAWPKTWNSSDRVNADIMRTWQHMIDADVLIPANSGFSKAASRYSLGLVLSFSRARVFECDKGAKPSTCLQRLPPPPKCTASTAERLSRVISEAHHVDYQCCFGRWRNETTSKCIPGCLAIGEDLRTRRPRMAALNAEGGYGRSMPTWSAAHACWVWCHAEQTRGDLIRHVHADAKRTPWETSLRHATGALVKAKAALHQAHAATKGRAPSARWRSLWQLVSRREGREGREGEEDGRGLKMPAPPLAHCC